MPNETLIIVLGKEKAMITNNFSRLPYEECLIPNLPKEIQHRVRDIGNYAVRPLNMSFAVMSCIFNALVIVTVARTKSLQRPSLLMLCSLAITDLIYALTVFSLREYKNSTKRSYVSW